MVRFAAAALALAVTLHGVQACGSELVLLDFWSPTCGPCMQMKPTVEAYINARYPIRQVDVSRETELARQYAVTGVPCFVMLVDGHEVDRVVGKTSGERLEQMFNRAKEVVETQRRVRTQSPSGPAQGVAAVDQAGWNGGGAGDEVTRSNAPDASPPTPGGVSGVSAAGPGAQPDENWPLEFNSKLLSTSVRLTVEDDKGRSHGTGTVIDARQGEALVITCGHLFRDTKGEAPVLVELFVAGREGVQVVEKVQGKVVSYDLDRDIALVSIRPTHTVCVAPVAPAQAQVLRGDRAASVGCSNGQDPTIMATRITWLDRYQGPPNIEANGAPVVGRSGGGLFNDQGQLVGVCFAADYEANKGLYAGLQSIHDELKRIGLEEIYAKPANNSLVNNESGSLAPVSADPIVRGQEPAATPPETTTAAELTATSASSAATASTDTAATTPQALSPTEDAALVEILNRATKRSVTCIIQSETPGDSPEIITLENVSEDFVRALAERQKSAGTTITR